MSESLIPKRLEYIEAKRSFISKTLKIIKAASLRFIGKYSFEDQINISSMCEPPLFFLKNGVMIPHPYAITLSCDEIGCDVSIGQCVTIGTNAKEMKLEDTTDGHKPKIGNLFRIYTHSVISGNITIGDCVIVSAGAIVTKDVPSFSIVYGLNEVRPLSVSHAKYLALVLYHCNRQYVKVPAIKYERGKLYIDNVYLKKREKLLRNLNSENFLEILKHELGSNKENNEL